MGLPHPLPSGRRAESPGVGALLLSGPFLRTSLRELETGVLSKKDICELPCIYTEKVNWLRKGTAFLSAKFLHKRYKNSF